MTINVIFRNVSAGFSIEKVFSEFIVSPHQSMEIRRCEVPCRRAKLNDILSNMHYVATLPKADVYHITGDVHYCVLPLMFRNTILTVHDTVLLDNCKNPVKKAFYFFFWFFLPCLFARKVICISETTKKAVQKWIPFKRMDVIHNPVPSSFSKCAKEFNAECPSILHIGTGWNKNLASTIWALQGIRCKLIIIGRLDDAAKELLAKTNLDYADKHDLTDSEIYQEYVQADIVSFPSIYEGFGMPIIEGQSVGRIVVTSDIEPMSEIGADSVCYVNPHDIVSMREGYKKCIEDRGFRERIISRGFCNVKRFNYELFSKNYETAYRSLKEKRV